MKNSVLIKKICFAWIWQIHLSVSTTLWSKEHNVLLAIENHTSILNILIVFHFFLIMKNNFCQNFVCQYKFDDTVPGVFGCHKNGLRSIYLNLFIYLSMYLYMNISLYIYRHCISFILSFHIVTLSAGRTSARMARSPGLQRTRYGDRKGGAREGWGAGRGRRATSGSPAKFVF